MVLTSRYGPLRKAAIMGSVRSCQAFFVVMSHGRPHRGGPLSFARSGSSGTPTDQARLRAMQRFSQLGAAQGAAGDEEQRHKATSIALGAIVPNLVASGDHPQARACFSAAWRSWNQRPNRRSAPRATLPRRIEVSANLLQRGVTTG